MKRILLSVVLILSLIFSLASCDFLMRIIPPKDAEALYERIDKQMNKLDSYEMQLSAHIKTYVEEIEIVANISGTAVVDEDYYYEFVNSKITSDEADFETECDTVIAYSDGKAYISNLGDSYNQKIYSTMTFDEFSEYIEKEDSSPDIADFQNCANKEYSKNEDSTWTLKYSGYSEESIDDFLDELSVEDIIDVDVKDMNVVLTADKSFRATQVDVKLVFDVESDEENVPDISFTVTYSDFNSAERVELDSTGYEQVDDIRIIGKLSDEIDDAADDTNASIYLSAKQTVRYQGSTSTAKEIYEGKYGVTDNDFYYDFDYKATSGSNSATGTVKYSDGKQTVKLDGYTQTDDCTEDEAKDTIKDLLRSIGFDPMTVKNVEKLADGYRLTCDVDKDAYAGTGYSVFSAEQVITLKYSGEEIKQIDSVTKVTTLGGPNMELTVVLIFDYEKAN